jgi:Lrp/AsnC family transcriptional regulator for asnA, asnC and gidA
MAIIDSLMQDGRKSFRQIAKEINVSTPTVESRFSRLKALGIIRNVVPIFNLDRVASHLSALVYIKTNPSQSKDVADKLALIPEVKSVYVITGDYNLIVKTVVTGPEYLEEMVRNSISPIEGIVSVSYHIVTRTLKEEQSVPVRVGTSLKVSCDYCDNDISKNAKGASGRTV